MSCLHDYRPMPSMYMSLILTEPHLGLTNFLP